MSTVPLSVTFTVPGVWWLSANHRPHWRVKARCTKQLRDLARVVARASQLPHVEGRAVVTSHISYPTDRRADPSNAAPTVKALIDGLVDAGVFVDDDSEHVVDGGYRRAPKTGLPSTYRVLLVIEVP